MFPAFLGVTLAWAPGWLSRYNRPVAGIYHPTRLVASPHGFIKLFLVAFDLKNECSLLAAVFGVDLDYCPTHHVSPFASRHGVGDYE
jgi:hypothetical protein